MARIAQVISIERVDEEGSKGTNLNVDEGGNTIELEHYQPPGVDACPLPGDFVAMDEDRENGIAYADVKNEDASEPGEIRIYARKVDGAIVVDAWLKKDGSAVIANEKGTFKLQSDGTVIADIPGKATFAVKPNGDIELQPTGKLLVGANPESALALAQKTDQRVGDLEQSFNDFLSNTFTPHTHPDALGTTAPTTSPATPVTPGDSTASQISFSE